MTYLLYAIRLPTSDFSIAYIGVTKKRISRRFNQHFSDPKSAIGEAIRQCGKENVLIEVLESGERDFIYAREVEMIKTLSLTTNGYNKAGGGTSGRGEVLQSTRRQMSANTRRRWGNGEINFVLHSAENIAKSLAARRQGMKHPPRSELALKRMSEAQQGKKDSAETRAKKSASHTGVKRGPMSAEQKAKISATRLRNKPFSVGNSFHDSQGRFISARPLMGVVVLP